MENQECIELRYRGRSRRLVWPSTVYVVKERSKWSIVNFYHMFIGSFFKECCVGVQVCGCDVAALHGPDCDEQPLNSYEEIVKDYINTWCTEVDREIQEEYIKEKELAEKYGADMPHKLMEKGKLYIKSGAVYQDVYDML